MNISYLQFEIFIMSDLIDIILLSGNVAYNKTAHQIGTYKDNVHVGYQTHVALRAVDGDIGPILADGCCAHPADDVNRQPAWWSVDLGDLYQINSIVFFARNEYYGWY